MELTVLGSSGSFGAPAAGGACSGYLVRAGDTSVWLDCGNGTFSVLQEHLPVADLSAVVISHAHPDHCVDLYGLHVLCRYGMQRSGLPVFAPAGLRDRLGALVNGWEDTFDWHDVDDGDAVTVDPIGLRFSRTDHPPPTMAVEVTGDEKRLVYTADTGPGWSVEAFESGADLVLSEASFLHADRRASLHLSAHEAGTGARAARARRLMITHLWPTLDPTVSVEEASEAFGDPVTLAAPHMVTQV
jgi:ribonuclease BN (tRNA processing enzyme)